MSHWSAELTSADEDDKKRPQPCETLQAASRCFNGPVARVRHIGGITILESTRFDQCVNGDAAFKVADELLLVLHHILNLYAYLHAPFETKRVFLLDEHDTVVKSRVRLSSTINVYGAAAIKELATARGDGTAGEFLVAQAFLRQDVAEALRLAQTRDLTWQNIYDILEFISSSQGGRKFHDHTETRRIRRTANHYRHPGNPRSTSLPKDPPKHAEARDYARESLKAWLAKTIK
jgi:hypothetical protein